MRLIKLEADGDFSLTDDIIGDVPPYAILSHTWRIDGDEVTLKDLLEGTAMSKAGYSKIHFCKKQAASDGLQYVWVDTCCIDKSSSAELQEAINSMFHWYRDATRCYVYLSDVSVGDCYKNNMTSQSSWELAFQASRWFTRGWTLQELLAPASVEFFSQEGKRLGDKKSLEHQVHKITGISIQALQGSPLSCFSISERFSWVKTRETKRKEDGAYSLLGIFNINMPLIYGEGMERAFIRLQKEIKESSKDEWPILPRRSGKEDDSQIRASSSSNGPAFYKSGPSKYELLHQRQDEASDIFGDVITRFRNSLGPNEKEIFKEFSSSGEMIVDLHSWCKDIRNRRKLTGLYRKIERFADFLEPIFRIINIYVPNRPEFAGATWGAMRLVFLLGLKHMTYLEKVVLMIQKIGESLPPYEEYFKLFISRNEKTESETGPALPTETRHYRLYKAVSYVYADIVQFCQESCKIFETKRSSVHHKPPVISESSWKPFDARFSSLLDRLRFHQGVFGCEMQLEESKYRELQYEKRARQPDLDEQVLQQILQQVKDLRLSNDLLESKITSLLENFENKLRENEFNKGVSKEIEQKDAEAINSKASDIEEWTDAPEYMRELEKAKSTRLPETGEYLLNDSVYKKWKFGKPSRHEEASVIVAPEIPRILFIKGKPGYGKTVLSSLLIEDLRTFTMSLAADISNYGSVFFYHFASERRDYCEPYYALRAVLVQLVHRFRSCKDIIDRISVLMESDNGGKLKASDEEIFAALSLLLEGLEHTFLVFDGLDECGEHTTFLELIRELCASTSTRVLLLGRPNVELPIQFQNLSLYLDQSSNLQDIKLYLEPQILLLQDRGLIPDETSLEAAVVTLASRAEGMFLWAWLMTQYLNCRALSPKERLEAIFEAADVEGLHDVYGKILRVLDQGYVKERASVRKIFGLMAIAFRPLLVTELRIAVAISPGKSTETSSLIVEFEESLPIICGALVEIQSDRTVRFIHSSFRTFLASASGPAHGSSFSIDERTTHVLCSTICLSYLIYDLPSSPLCQTSNANIEDLKVSFPFIEYALQWVKHAASGFQANDINSIPLELKIQDNFYTILAKFISRPLTITVWIEASGMFCMKPSLKVLTALRSSQDFHLVSASPFNTGNIAVTLLEELATDLERLDTEWGHLLKQDPSAIWGPSITAFARSPFWFETKNTVVSSMLPTEATGSFRSCSPERPVLIQSQISGDSRELGIVLVLPSNYLIVAESVLGAPTRKSRQDSPLLSDEEKQRLAKVCSFEWKVRYQRRNIRNEEILMDFEVELPDRQIFQMLQQCISSKTPHRFPFPVAFSHDLNRLIVLRCVLIIRLVPIVESGAVVPQCRLQSLEREVHPEPDANSSERTAFYSVFSPDAKALAFVFGRLQPNAIDCRRVRVWSEAAVGDWPSYQYKGEAMTSRLSWQGEASRDQFAFHPYLPLMVFTEWNATVAWMFNSVRPLKIYTIITRPVTSLSFSKNGFFLLYRSVEPGNVGREQESRTFARSQRILDYGYESGHAYYNHPPGIDLAPSFDSPSSFQAHDIFNLHPFVTERLIDLRHDVPHEISALFFNQSHRALRATNSSLNRNDGWTDVTSSTQNEKLSQALQVSPLQSTSSTSTLINHQTTQQATHSGVVIAGSRLLAHLPRLQQGEETYISLLPCEENDKWVRMVWNKAAQNTYSIYDYQTPHLPSIIYRQQGTIEKNDNDLQTAKRPRLVL